MPLRVFIDAVFGDDDRRYGHQQRRTVQRQHGQRRRGQEQLATFACRGASREWLHRKLPDHRDVDDDVVERQYLQHGLLDDSGDHLDCDNDEQRRLVD